MTGQGSDLDSRGRVPQFDVAIGAAGGDELAVWADRDRLDGAGVFGQQAAIPGW